MPIELMRRRLRPKARLPMEEWRRVRGFSYAARIRFSLGRAAGREFEEIAGMLRIPREKIEEHLRQAEGRNEREKWASVFNDLQQLRQLVMEEACRRFGKQSERELTREEFQEVGELMKEQFARPQSSIAHVLELAEEHAQQAPQ